MGSHSYLQNLGDTYVKNAQLQGQTNFLNQYGHGNTQVDNLSGLRGSVQNFGLQELFSTYYCNDIRYRCETLGYATNCAECGW